jgi:hypothetical protein
MWKEIEIFLMILKMIKTEKNQFVVDQQENFLWEEMKMKEMEMDITQIDFEKIQKQVGNAIQQQW